MNTQLITSVPGVTRELVAPAPSRASSQAGLAAIRNFVVRLAA